MNPDDPTEHKKKPYEKPKLSEVALRPEEAVLGNCKSSTSVGPAQADCITVAMCSSLGSVNAGFTLDIAGLAIALTTDADLPIAAEGSARKFVRAADAAGPAPTARLHARWGDPRAPEAAPLIFDSGKGLWRLYGGGPRAAVRLFVARSRRRAVPGRGLQ